MQAPTPPPAAAEEAPRNLESPKGYERNIEFDYITGDYRLELRKDGGPWTLEGWAKSYSEGDAVLDTIVYERLIHDARLQPVR
jgi:hypothetical protein